MPTVLRSGPYRFFFYSNELGEPPHVHVARDQFVAKFWLPPATLAKNNGFPEHELNRIREIVVRSSPELFAAWYDYFGS